MATHPKRTDVPASAATTRRLVIYANPSKAGLREAIDAIWQWAIHREDTRLSVAQDIRGLLSDAGASSAVECFDCESSDTRPFRRDENSLLICLGGDGTLIHAVRRLWPIECPALAVNLGSLGFNASVEPEDLAAALDAWAAGQAHLSERMVLGVTHWRGERRLATSIAVNDVVLGKPADTRMASLRVAQGGHAVAVFPGDGVIAATPTGSTAHSLAAGGPVVHPALSAVVIVGICPHTLTMRPVVLPPGPPIEIELVRRDAPVTTRADDSRLPAELTLDGQDHWSIAPGERVTVLAEQRPLRLIANAKTPFFARLHEKFHWCGELPRLNGSD